MFIRPSSSGENVKIYFNEIIDFWVRDKKRERFKGAIEYYLHDKIMHNLGDMHIEVKKNKTYVEVYRAQRGRPSLYVESKDGIRCVPRFLYKNEVLWFWGHYERIKDFFTEAR